ncbi:MAG: MarR family transcriptional regulator [Eubacteriales bacterium]|nr:MarR family transcriptional regulator [Eubacteriales bacterium]
MNFNDETTYKNVDFGDMPPQTFLLGLLSAFENRYQAVADKFFQEITWKQFFAVICINLCKESPTLNDLAEVMGSSHQNVKQILLKLERTGFVETRRDESDKRKQRIYVTEKCMRFCETHHTQSQIMMGKMFEGVDEDAIITTIQTIMKIEENLRSL